MVKQLGQSHPDVPPLPPGLADDDLHHVANAAHSAALRLLPGARGRPEMDLDGPRASALSVVLSGPVPIGRLAEIEQVSAPAITKTVAALEAGGLVERVRSTSDRRVVRVAATPAGRATLERGRRARIQRVADLLDGLPPEDLATVAAAARIISERLAGQSAAAPS